MTRAFRPKTIGEACALLADRALGAVAIAGGTDFMVQAHATHKPPAAVVDLLSIEALCGIELGQGAITIGATTPFSLLRRDKRIRERLPILAEVREKAAHDDVLDALTRAGLVAIQAELNPQ